MAEAVSFSAASSTSDSSSPPELYNPSKNVTSSKAMNRNEKPNHPSTADMVTEAIVHLSERGGSSLLAIKKYITKTYKLDVDKQAMYIKKYLKSAVANGSLVQTTGRGASGSFKMPSAKQKAAMAKTAFEENGTSAKKSPASMKKKSVKVRASAKKESSKKTEKKKSAANMKSKENTSPTATPTEPKSPSKTKKTVKSPTSKPKVPKPKKATVSKSMNVVAPKKTVVKK